MALADTTMPPVLCEGPSVSGAHTGNGTGSLARRHEQQRGRGTQSRVRSASRMRVLTASPAGAARASRPTVPELKSVKSICPFQGITFITNDALAVSP
jgi:hypothetical protein